MARIRLYKRPAKWGTQIGPKGGTGFNKYRSRQEARAKCSQCRKTDWGPVRGQQRARMGGVKDAEVCHRHRGVSLVAPGDVPPKRKQVAWPKKPSGIEGWAKIRKMDRLPV